MTPESGRLVTGGEERRDLSGDAFQVLSYNQELVQFADAKAGTLVLVNSVFLAAAGDLTGWARLPGTAGLAAAALAVAASLWVVVVGAGGSPPPFAPADLVFFEDIRRRRWASEYVEDFVRCPEGRLAEQFLRRAYGAAGIAQRKFRAYGVAKAATAVAAAAWIAARILHALP